MRMKKISLDQELGKISKNFGKYPIRNQTELNDSISFVNAIRKRLNQLKDSEDKERTLRNKAFCEGKLPAFTSNALSTRKEKQ